MTSRISHTTVDAHNAYEQSVWWCQVLGFGEDPQDPNRPGDEECMIFSPDGRSRVLFIEVPDDKVVKNRLHFDLSPTDRTPRRGGRAAAGAGRHRVRRPSQPGRQRLGDDGRSGGQRVLRVA